MDKSIVVTVERKEKHPKYGKFLKKAPLLLLMMKKMSVMKGIQLRLWRQGPLVKVRIEIGRNT